MLIIQECRKRCIEIILGIIESFVPPMFQLRANTYTTSCSEYCPIFLVQLPKIVMCSRFICVLYPFDIARSCFFIVNCICVQRAHLKLPKRFIFIVVIVVEMFPFNFIAVIIQCWLGPIKLRYYRAVVFERFT